MIMAKKKEEVKKSTGYEGTDKKSTGYEGTGHPKDPLLKKSKSKK